MIEKEQLQILYVQNKSSVAEIAQHLGCSQNKVTYYMDKHGIARRSRSEAVYIKYHPNGDPFSVKPIQTMEDAKLLGTGIGLYWGEGTKTSLHSVRIGNTDPELIKTFMQFLIKLFGVDKDDMRFGLQIFTDINPQAALNFWTTELGVKDSQFYKITVTISGSIGTYRKKSQYGVVTLHYHNKKLRDIIVGLLPR